jgi:hypothetical protein
MIARIVVVIGVDGEGSAFAACVLGIVTRYIYYTVLKNTCLHMSLCGQFRYKVPRVNFARSCIVGLAVLLFLLLGLMAGGVSCQARGAHVLEVSPVPVVPKQNCSCHERAVHPLREKIIISIQPDEADCMGHQYTRARSNPEPIRIPSG